MRFAVRYGTYGVNISRAWMCSNGRGDNMIKKINHIAIVVPELEEALSFWQEALGLQVEHAAHVADQAVDVAFLPVGDSNIELLRPTAVDSGVGRYLQKRGPGLHHICFEVTDIEAALARLKEQGVPLIDEVAKVDADGKKLAFVHPRGANGVLVELYELPS